MMGTSYFTRQQMDNHNSLLSKNCTSAFHIFESFGLDWWDEEVQLETWLIIISALKNLHSALQDRRWVESTRGKPGTNLTFRNLFNCLDFVCNFIEIFYAHYLPTNTDPLQITREQGVSEISFLIIRILQSIFEMESLTLEENILVRNRLATSVPTYENWTSEKPHLLLKACAFPMTPNAIFKVIRLLLNAGADPNAVDDDQRSPLHLLAINECSLAPWRSRENVSELRAKTFTAIVRQFLEAGYRTSLTDSFGRAALDVFEIVLEVNQCIHPDYGFMAVLREFKASLKCSCSTQVVRSLSCACATMIQKLHVSCSRLPADLRSFVRRHL